MKESETERLGNIDREISERVVGQKDAIAEISKAVRRARTGLAPPAKWYLYFLGPTG